MSEFNQFSSLHLSSTHIKNWHAVNCKTCWVVWEFDYTRGQLFLAFRRAHAQL
ncbi:unnamed protein product [Ixodes pacificus]